MDYFPSIQNGRIEWDESIELKKWMGFCNIQSWDVIDGVCFTYHPDALTYIVPQWHPVSAWSNSPLSFHLQSVQKLLAAHRHTKQNSKHSGMTFELLVCMWALVSCMCSGTSRLVVLSRKTGKPIRLHYEIKVVSLGTCRCIQTIPVPHDYHAMFIYTWWVAQPRNQTLQTIHMRDLRLLQPLLMILWPWKKAASPHPDSLCLHPHIHQRTPHIFVAFGVPYPRACSAALLP